MGGETAKVLEDPRVKVAMEELAAALCDRVRDELREEILDEILSTVKRRRKPKPPDSPPAPRRTRRPSAPKADAKPPAKDEKPETAPSPGSSDVMTTAEAAEFLGCVPGTLHAHRNKGTGPPSQRMRGNVFYQKRDLVAWRDRKK